MGIIEVKLAVWLLGTAFFIWYSWPYFKQPRAHGFARFFLWEVLLVLLLLNISSWFAEPFSARQILSWLALMYSIVVVILGFAELRRRGRAQGSFENTTRLVASGIYRYIRHPMYASLVFLGLGIYLKHISLASTLLCAACLVCGIWTARLEEAENLAHFGEEYAAYIRQTKRFFPWVV